MTAMSHSLQENPPFAGSLFAEAGFLGHDYLLGVGTATFWGFMKEGIAQI